MAQDGRNSTKLIKRYKMNVRDLLDRLNPLGWSRPVQLLAAGALLGGAAFVLLSGGC